MSSDDAIVAVSTAALGLSDALFLGDTSCRPQNGTILGHQAVGTIVEVGAGVRKVATGDRVAIAATVACGTCAFCRVGFFAQCVSVKATNVGVGGVYLGGPGAAPALNGTSSELVRVPFADIGLTVIPEDMNDATALLFSEVFPAGYFAAKLSLVCAGDRVAVFGADPAGVVAAITAVALGAGELFIVDDDLAPLKELEDERIHLVEAAPQDSAEALLELTEGRGVQCAIVSCGAGIDHVSSRRSSVPPSQLTLDAAADSLSRDSTLSVTGPYPPGYAHFPLGRCVSKYVTVKAAACNHSKYTRPLLNMLSTGLLSGTFLANGRMGKPFPDDLAAVESLCSGATDWAYFSCG